MTESRVRTISDVLIDPQRVLDLAADLIRAPSVSPAGEADVAAAIGLLLRREGIEYRLEEVAPGRPNLIVEMGDGQGPTLWFNGHLDTVPIGNRLAWCREPFGGDIHEGRMSGRGASDCKAGVAAMIHAAIALQRARVSLHGRLRLTAVMGDEEGWVGIRHLLDRGMHADAFVSTQWSTAGQIALGYRGLCWIEVTTMGRIAHGSRHALFAATSHAAEAIGVASTRGTLQPGKRADVISVKGNPIDDIGCVAARGCLYKNGVSFEDLSAC